MANEQLRQVKVEMAPEATCGVTEALSLIRGKWTTPVLRELIGGPLRFGDLRRRLRGVSARALSETLQAMETNDLVVRRFHSEMPPRTEYRLSQRAQSLMPVFEAMNAWAREDRDDAEGSMAKLQRRASAATPRV